MSEDPFFDVVLDVALRTAAEKGELHCLLEEWLELHDTPCRYDHHGYCQEHFLQDNGDCIVQRTRDILNVNK